MTSSAVCLSSVVLPDMLAPVIRCRLAASLTYRSLACSVDAAWDAGDGVCAVCGLQSDRGAGCRHP
jgi:hypothetical protein